MYYNMLNKLYKDENDDILSDILVDGYKAYAEGMFDGTKSVFGAMKSGARSVTSAKNKLGTSDIAQGIKNACGKLLLMLQNLLKSIFNGTAKLKSLIKNIENQERKFTVQQDGKEKKVIKTVTIRNLVEMGFSNGEPSENKVAQKAEKKNGGASLYSFYQRFNGMKTGGSQRAKMDFTTKENAIKSLNAVARPNLAKVGHDDFSDEDNVGNIGKKWKLKPNDDVTKVMSADEFGRMIQELYGYGYSSGKSDGKQFKEMTAMYFKQPLTTKVSNEDGKAFSIVKGSLTYVKEAGKVLLSLNADEYIKAELEEIKRTQKELERLNRENVKGAKDAEERSNGETNETDVNKVNQEDAKKFFGGNDPGNKAKSESFSLYLIREAMKAYGESAMDEQDQELENDKAEVSKTKTSDDASSIDGIFKYIRSFLINYAIAIQKTMNYFNAFIMNLVTAGKQLLNDLATLGKATNGGSEE